MANIGQDPADNKGGNTSKDKYHLLKNITNEDIGKRDADGSVKEFFDNDDVGAIQSSAALQPLHASEFKTSPVQPNTEWINVVKTGTKQFSGGRGGSTKHTINWTVTGDNAVDEVSAVSAVLADWDVVGFPRGKQFGAFFWPKIRDWLKDASSKFGSTLNNADQVKTALAGIRDDPLETYLNKSAGVDTSFANLDAANIQDSINLLIGSTPEMREDILYNKQFYDFNAFYNEIRRVFNTTNDTLGPIFSSTIFGEFKQLTSQPHVISGVMANYQAIRSQTITGLSDTPSGYVSGQYLRATASGIQFADISQGSITFTGLADTPTGYESGQYLRATASGIQFADVSQNFAGLSDTPTGYESGKFLISNTGNIEFSDVGFLTNVSDRPSSELISGFLRLDKDRNLVWDAGTTSGDITYSISGATHITGLADTPAGYEEGKFLKSTSNGFEYASISEAVGSTALTGLSDTPTGYEEGKFLKSTTNGLEWADAGSSSSTCSGGAIAANANWKQHDNFYTDLPDAISLPFHNSIDTTGVFHLSQIYSDELYYENSTNYYITFLNTPVGETLSSQTVGFPAAKLPSSLSGCVASGFGLYYGGCGDAGSTCSGDGGIGSNTGVQAISNFYKNMPDHLLLPENDGAGETWTGLYGLAWIEENTTQYSAADPAYFIQFDNDLEGTFKAEQHTDYGASLSGLVADGRAFYVGGCSSPAGAGGSGSGSGSTTFTGLSDTPESYLGVGGQYLRVTTGESAIEFVPLSAGGGGSMVYPDDADPALAGQSIIASTGDNTFKKLIQGPNINFVPGANGLQIGASYPQTVGTVLSLSDTPAAYSASRFLKTNPEATKVEFVEVDLSMPVGSGFAKHAQVSSKDSFTEEMPEHIYLRSADGNHVQTFAFTEYLKHAVNGYIEYAPTRSGVFGSHIKFEDDAAGTFKSSDATSLESHNQISLSGYISDSRVHHEAARNTGVYNQGLRAVLHAGSAELEEDPAIEPELLNVIGTYNNWSQLSFVNSDINECKWTIPPSLTKNYLDGEVELDISWIASEINGDVVWNVKLEAYAAGDDIDVSTGSSFREIVSASPSRVNGLVNSTITFKPELSELKPSSMVVLTIKRDPNAAGDTMLESANVLFASIMENI